MGSQPAERVRAGDHRRAPGAGDDVVEHDAEPAGQAFGGAGGHGLI